MTQQPDSEKSRFELLLTTPWDQFLAESPPGTEVTVTDFCGVRTSLTNFDLACPQLSLHCPNSHCERDQFFSGVAISGHTPTTGETVDVVLEYESHNCKQYQKKIAVALLPQSFDQGKATKYGESPPFGPVVPSRVLRLIGDQESVKLFMKGRRAEAQGLGIGASAYYRRVVENQKDRIFDAIIKVAKTVGADEEQIRSLEEAKKVFQFKKSVDEIKLYIPASLRIKTHNPLTLLHKALSRAIHDLSDEECLEQAREIRLVLTEFSRKVAEALRDDADLTAAVSRLMGPSPADAS